MVKYVKHLKNVDIGGTKLLTPKDLFTNDGVKGIVFCWSVFSSVDLCSLSFSVQQASLYFWAHYVIWLVQFQFFYYLIIYVFPFAFIHFNHIYLI